MATEETTAINALTAQTSGLLDTCVALKAGVSQQITDAVTASTNAALIPLMTMATNLTSMQALLVTYIARG